MLMVKCTSTFHAIKDVIHVQYLWSQKVVLDVSLQKYFTKLQGLLHLSPKM